MQRTNQLAALAPVNDCVLIDPEPPPEYHVYKGYFERAGLVVPDQYSHGPEDRPVWGHVVAVGPQVTVGKVLQEGDRVVFGKYAGARIKHQEKDYLLVRDYDILAVDG